MQANLLRCGVQLDHISSDVVSIKLRQREQTFLENEGKAIASEKIHRKSINTRCLFVGLHDRCTEISQVVRRVLGGPAIDIGSHRVFFQ